MRYSPEQIEWIRDQCKTKAGWEVLPLFNEKFNLNITKKQFKCLRTNHKIQCVRKPIPRQGLFPEEIQKFILEHYKEWEAPYMAQQIKNIFDVTYSARQIKYWKNNRHLDSGLTGAWNKNRPNPHKGQKGWYIPGSEKNRFEKGIIPPNKLEVMTKTKRVGAGNYWFIKIAEPNVWISYARYVWEQANGPLKPGEKIKFLDGNKDNCNLDNLIVINDQVQGMVYRKYSPNPELTKAYILKAKLFIKINEKQEN